MKKSISLIILSFLATFAVFTARAGEIVTAEKLRQESPEGEIFPFDFIVDNVAYSINEEERTLCIVNPVPGLGADGYVGGVYPGDFTSIYIHSRIKYNGKSYEVKEISGDAFMFYKSVTSIVVDSENKYFDSRNNCNAVIETATNTLVRGCNNTVIPDGVVKIGSGAFSGYYWWWNACSSNYSENLSCSDFTSIFIPSSVREIGECAFEGCTGLTSVVFSNSVESIKERAFAGCTGLTSLSIPASVKEIGDYAFYRCTGITSVTIPRTVSLIGRGAFAGCGLNSIAVEEGNPNFDSRNNCNAIIETHTKTLVAGCNNSVIPNGIVKVGDYAFFNCSRVNKLTIPRSVTQIGEGAFVGCSGLTSIVVDKGNLKYDSRNNCNAIIEKATRKLIAGCATTVIPQDVVVIGYGAFNGCDKLTSIIIPKRVKKIEEYAFYNATGLTKIVSLNPVPPISFYAPYGGDVFDYSIFSTATLYVPRGSIRAYSRGMGPSDDDEYVFARGFIEFKHIEEVTPSVLEQCKHAVQPNPATLRSPAAHPIPGRSPAAHPVNRSDSN